ncbi:proline--tRNA ligase [Leptospira borgpetersenii]|uniref:Proline--tRNA ligase n=4 Tax=Leptospira borgpetersenii TaxID=174 RepID=M3F840_LEPBO|nr:proline--tRNA ligase [Leptospira borgpetersenii]EMF98077.1 proline--tRNA ligase [Leptospira borgpetersenii str. 200701203]EMO09765.1 proline--tRNA ligase [Leptospira borgpetersenii str. Noumea 25]ALO24865.1 proline--tRNA ligase [Leptospira borgpetersenii serovar Ballum]APY24765.1 Proline--tRNA ligase [Leptospira borgpetersenii str. 4E]AXX15369.1 proline--tRNA ligase [Leptospira borgpetersenii serovar Ceylonica]
MKASKYILPTEKENPSDAVVASHRLMIRAGLARKSSAGLYFYLPLGLKVLQKITQIIREEMNKTGALEFDLPILTPSDFWEQSGRWTAMGKEMFRIKDRHDLSYALGPTHEESFSFLLKPLLKSYKDLPLNVYQIQTKFRDEIRPRFGVIRSREFIMKDAYSFHIDDVSLDETYQSMRAAYRKIFDRCGLKTIPVQADSGSMGGSASEEFMVVSPIGEETLLLCNSCGYSSNSEKTPLVLKKENVSSASVEKKEISTPGKKTIAEVSAFLGIPESTTIKAAALKSEKKKILVYLRGDLELNLHKLHSLLRIVDSEPMTDAEIRELGLVPGFIAPVAPNDKVKVLYDRSLQKDFPYVVGSNKEDFHTQGFVLEKEVSGLPEFADVALAREGDLCPNCNAPLKAEKGIEVGHIFKLGEKYTKAFGIQVLDQNGKARTLTMGCYGIGVNRTMATVIEQRNDEKGIFWPISIAPFEVTLVSITKGEEQYSKAEEFYNVLKNENLEVFWDDRDVGPGFKLKDSELIGFPIRVTIGKKFFENGEISIYNRKTDKEESFVFAGFENLIARVESLRQKLFVELE